MGQEPTTVVTGEPAISFNYDPKRSLYDQFSRTKKGEADGDDAHGSDSADTCAVIKMINPADSLVSHWSSSSDERSGEDSRPRAGPSAAFVSLLGLPEGFATRMRRRSRQREPYEDISDNTSSADSVAKSVDEDQVAPSIGHRLAAPNEHLAVLLPRNLWKQDTDALHCDTFVCRKPFTFMERRHVRALHACLPPLVS